MYIVHKLYELGTREPYYIETKIPRYGTDLTFDWGWIDEETKPDFKAVVKLPESFGCPTK